MGCLKKIKALSRLILQLLAQSMNAGMVYGLIGKVTLVSNIMRQNFVLKRCL